MTCTYEHVSKFLSGEFDTLIVPAADVRPDAAFEQPRSHLQQLDAEEDKDDTAGSYAELMEALAQKVRSTTPHPHFPYPYPYPYPYSYPYSCPRGPKPMPFDCGSARTFRGSPVSRGKRR